MTSNRSHLSLWSAVVVSLGEFRLRLTGKDSNFELSHRVHVLGEISDHRFDICRDSGALVEFLEIKKQARIS